MNLGNVMWNGDPTSSIINEKFLSFGKTQNSGALRMVF